MPKSILIVDDGYVMRQTLRQTLQGQHGWEVCGEAVNGREGIEKAQELKPDAIVLDLSMPVMNGLEATRELKSLLPSTPVLLFTDFDTPHVKQAALSAGARAVVSKSDSEILVSSLRGLLAEGAS